jgi:hypothetical protein
MTVTVSTLPGFAYCYNDKSNPIAGNGLSAIVQASVGALALNTIAPSVAGAQGPQFPYPTILDAVSAGGVPGGAGQGSTTQPLGVVPSAGGFNFGQQTA